MSIEISPETEARMVAEATRLGVSVEMLLRRFMDDLEARTPAEFNGPRPELPIFHPGAVGSLRREDIYGDVD